ncbi:60S ribosomal protein L33B [Extremus antarcticus]|uniref:60S ribosomal protein L33B n=1 Tax=Extremus antarcticus TaxID=702011 RepID=A0AAJ0G7K6_9PEZI|nr:60S ribosomal protein L33B [Extremus antarcticus]
MIEGVDNSKAASFYLGKRIAYVYRGKREIRGSKIRVIWGKVTRTHVQAQPAAKELRCDGADNALPQRDMSAATHESDNMRVDERMVAGMHGVLRRNFTACHGWYCKTGRPVLH